MTTFCLASEYDRLTPSQKDRVDHILADDGTWTIGQIANAMGNTDIFDITTERREGYVYDKLV